MRATGLSPGTKELAEEHARHYGLRIELVRRELGDLLVQIEQRGKFPDKQNRFCTSDHKTSQVEKLITRLAWEHRERLGWRAHSRDPRAPRVRVLNCLGFRSEESPDRAKQPVFCLQTSTSVRTVDRWLPIHDWTVSQVWDRIRDSGVPYHYAYDLGMSRLSCRFCVLAWKKDLLISARYNPELAAEYLRVERKIGHRFKRDLSLEEIVTLAGLPDLEPGGEPATGPHCCWSQLELAG